MTESVQMKKFGTFSGVFLPSILTILGVVMYLRMGWVVGNVGMFQTFIIVTLSSSITFLTALSISSTATNMKVGAGGAYYMVSRSFGIESGSAVGLPLYMAQAVGAAFYITGFSESVQVFLPWLPHQVIGLLVLVLISALAYYSADFALRIQLLIFVLIAASLFSAFLGSPLDHFDQAQQSALHEVSFWSVFAIFFPAVTGILSGVSMSGDLKNPGQSIPLGTVAAVVVGYLVYLMVPWIMWHAAPAEDLVNDSMILGKISVYRPAIYAGIWGATLSSALGSMLAAPRTLRALATDRIVPSLFGKTSANNSPQMATVLTFCIAAFCVVLGDLNLIAPVLTMFFLVTYGILNLVSGVEGVIGSPTWRPTFKMHWMLSFAGAAACLGVMLMINAGATYIAMLICCGLYFWVRQREIRTHFADMRPGMILFLVRKALYQLETFELNERSWRPDIALVTGLPQKNPSLIEIADAFAKKRGFTTLGVSFDQDVRSFDDPERMRSREKMLQKWVADKGIQSLVKIAVGCDEFGFTGQMLDFYGLGSLRPNIYLYDWNLDKKILSACLRLVYQNKRNSLVIRNNGINSIREISDRVKNPKINIWWGQREEVSGPFMLTLAHLLRESDQWKDSFITIYTVIDSESARVRAEHALNFLVAESRLKQVTANLLLRTDQSFFDLVQDHSKYADITFFGLPLPGEVEDTDVQVLEELFEKTAGLGFTIYARTGESVNLKKVFTD
ncbi:MAG: amino acid permease [Deltaproteobacteria bacterium]|nr:amino acid permease [Deltaproteobacteria bacterium]